MTLAVIPLYVWSLIVFFLPGAAVVAELVRRNKILRPAYALILMAASSALAGYVAFWIYFASRTGGKLFSYAVVIPSAVIVWRRLHSDNRLRQLFRELVPPLLYMAAIGSCYIAFMYIPANPFVMGQDIGDWRLFSYQLPGDNIIPWIFANKILHRESLLVIFGDWLSSDRPPLQTGIFLLYWPFKVAGKAGLGFQLISSGVQSLWICAVWVLLRSLRAGAHRFTQVLAFLAPSGFFLYNVLYTWPKLLGASFVLFAIAILITALLERRPMTSREAVLASLCVGLGFLAHPGIVGTLPCFALILLIRKAISWRAAAWGLAVLLAVCLPWSAYQKYIDPPGNRLVKMHLAADGGVDSRSVWEAVKDAYRENPSSVIIQNKLKNIEGIIGPHPLAGYGITPWPVPGVSGNRGYLEAVEIDQREFIWNALGFLSLGVLVIPIALAKKIKLAIPYSGRLIAVAIINLLIWSLIMFGPRGTITTHSSYGDVLLLMVGLSGFILTLPQWVGAIVFVLTVANDAVFWLSAFPHGGTFPWRIQWPLLIFATLGSAALVVHFFRAFLPREESALISSKPSTYSLAAESN